MMMIMMTPGLQLAAAVHLQTYLKHTNASTVHRQAGFGSVVDAAYSFPLVASYMLNTRWRVELDVASARAYVCCCSGFFEPELNFNDFG